MRTTALYDALGDLRAAVDEAYEAALGKADPKTDKEITPPSGDYEGYFEKAKAKLGAVPSGYRRMAELALAAAASFPPASAEREPTDEQIDTAALDLAIADGWAAANDWSVLTEDEKEPWREQVRTVVAALRSAEGGEGR